ncbi:hypothetical protein N7488_003288 [Penicillium malachiteum]|nr:hypothetical protein N7488_003288 [Penicillium malachiteum]
MPKSSTIHDQENTVSASRAKMIANAPSLNYDARQNLVANPEGFGSSISTIKTDPESDHTATN